MNDKFPEAGCGAAIRNAAGELLLIQRLKEPEAGAWGLPGGKIDFGEPARITAAREIKEELGITIEVGALACVSEIIDRGDGRHWVSPVFHATILDGEPSVQEPEKHGACGWFALGDLPERLTTPTKFYLESLKTG